MDRLRRTAKLILGALGIGLVSCSGMSPWLAARLPPLEVTDGISGAELRRHVAKLSSDEDRKSVV